jgi:hypothetical protein
MNRRGFLGAVAALAVAPLAPAAEPVVMGVDLASGPDMTAMIARCAATMEAEVMDNLYLVCNPTMYKLIEVTDFRPYRIEVLPPEKWLAR